MPTWLDVNSAFGLNGKNVLLADAEAISNSIYNILTCPIGSRGWNPSYGSMLPFMIYEPVDQITATSIRVHVLEAIRNWEPRVDVIAERSSVVPMSGGAGYDVVITYRLRSDGSVSSANFSFVR